MARAVLILVCLWAAPALATGPVDVYQFDNDAQRERYKALIDEFRCPKCLNTNIAGSDAPIAQDLRRTVHRLVVVEGYTNEEVTAYLQQRYGDFILYKPPFNARTWLIWMLPVALLAVGLCVLLVMYMRVRGRRSKELEPDERARLATLLGQD